MNSKQHGSYIYDSSKEVDVNLQDKIIDIIATLYDISSDKISMESHFKKDLGLDSLDMVEISMELEDEFNIFISDSDIEKIHYVGDIFKVIVGRNPKPGGK